MLDDGVMLRSQAQLAASLSADWDTVARESARSILTRVAAETRARAVREVRALIDTRVEQLIVDLAARFDASAPFGPPTPGTPLVLHAPKRAVFALIDALRAAGAGTVTVATLEDVFDPSPPLVATFDDALSDAEAKRLRPTPFARCSRWPVRCRRTERGSGCGRPSLRRELALRLREPLQEMKRRNRLGG